MDLLRGGGDFFKHRPFSPSGLRHFPESTPATFVSFSFVSALISSSSVHRCGKRPAQT
jgi:hypothetical protein